VASKRRKTWQNRLRQAAPWAAALAVLDGFFSVAARRSDPLAALAGVLFSFLIALALALVGFYTIERTRFWRRFVAPPVRGEGSLDPDSQGLAPYHWSGKPPIKAIGLGLLAIGVTMAAAAIVIGGSLDETSRLLLIFAVFTTVLFGAPLAGGMFLLRGGQSVTVDDEGVRWEGRLRSDFRARWSEIATVEVAAFPMMPPGGAQVHILVLRARDGNRLGSLAPIGWMGRGEFASLERAVRSHAERRAVPVVSVAWRSAGRKGTSQPTVTAIHPR